MNAPETLTVAINPAHEILMQHDEALSADRIAFEINGRKKATKTQVKESVRQLQALAGLGMIEMEPRTGGVPFYRLIQVPAIAAPSVPSEDLPAKTYPPAVLQSMIAGLSSDSEDCETDAPAWAADPALQYLAPEDCENYEMPPADPALPAMANRELRHQLSSIATTCAEYLPDPSDITTVRAVEIMDMLINAQKGYIRVLEDRASVAASLFDHLKGSQLERDDLRDRLHQQIEQWQADTGRLTADLRAAIEARSKAINEADRLRAELAAERQAREALQEQAGTIPAARRYLVVSGGDRSFVTHKLETARKDAERLARNTKLRVDVFALTPVGSARIAPSVQWKAAQ